MKKDIKQVCKITLIFLLVLAFVKSIGLLFKLLFN